jgi:hypothetical protein
MIERLECWLSVKDSAACPGCRSRCPNSSSDLGRALEVRQAASTLRLHHRGEPGSP